MFGQFYAGGDAFINQLLRPFSILEKALYEGRQRRKL